MINTYLNLIKAILTSKIRNLIVLILNKNVRLFDLIKILYLVIFVFLKIDKFGFKVSLTILLLLILIAIEANILNNSVFFNIEVNNTIILQKYQVLIKSGNFKNT